MSDNESPPPGPPAEGTIDEVVERTRSMLRKSRDLLQSSRDLLNKVHQPGSRAKASPEKTDGDDGRGSS
ncbi:hypothetical protein [Longimicrobium sp.]|jgi:hypothetical protein|uniref:hypothetical protein n=1 Tax=Longimicrobium sp. TaxID=2029185 RepID=UPI002F95927C